LGKDVDDSSKDEVLFKNSLVSLYRKNMIERHAKRLKNEADFVRAKYKGD